MDKDNLSSETIFCHKPNLQQLLLLSAPIIKKINKKDDQKDTNVDWFYLILWPSIFTKICRKKVFVNFTVRFRMGESCQIHEVCVSVWQ